MAVQAIPRTARDEELELLIREVEEETRRRRRRQKLRLWAVVGVATLLLALILAIAGVGGAARDHRAGALAPKFAPLGAAGTAALNNCQSLATALGASAGDSFSVQAAYASTAAQVATWEAQRDGTGTGLFSSDPPSETLSVCFLTGGPYERTPLHPDIHYNAVVMEILPSGYAVPDVIINGTTVPYSAPMTTTEIPTVSHPVY
jgi:hypothetical protein